MSLNRERINEDLKLLPNLPGSYQMYNDQDEIIYVGKAKNLFNRVHSYFTGAHDAKTTRMVQDIAYFKYIITNTELEALILENNLIKENHPKYNIMLMDDKTYPYIVLTNEKDPRILYTRDIKHVKKGSKVFGPYPNVKACKDTVEILNKVFPYRKCHIIPHKNCLYYDMHQCLAPCINKLADNVYDEYKETIIRFLNGNDDDLIITLKQKMKEASESLNFELALEYKKMIESLESAAHDYQKITIHDGINRDIFGYAIKNGIICIQVFHMRGGNIIKRSGEVFDLVGETDDILASYIYQFYDKSDVNKPKSVLIPYFENYQILEELLDLKFTVPVKGIKKQLVDLASQNASEDLDNLEIKRMNHLGKTAFPLEELAKLLNIEYPKVIEIFDNSNIQGTSAVSGMVTYIDGVKSVKDYRKFKIKTIVGADDYHTMMEVLERRYTRVLKDNLRKPNLLIVDGGIPQVKAAKSVIDKIGIKLHIMGLAKDDKHRTRAIIDENYNEITIDKRSNLFLLLEQMQDEVHRYAITYFKKTHTKTLFESKLDTIEGIGANRKKRLFKEFGSLEEIKNASTDKLKALGLPQNVIDNLKQNL